MNNIRLSEIEIQIYDPLMNALKIMDNTNLKLLIVKDDNEFRGLLSIGDIQRYIIHHGNLNALVRDALRDDILSAYIDDDINDIKDLMLKNRIEFMPILGADKQVVNVLFWDDLFKNDNEQRCKELSNIPVVIMAGGKGTRLRPITNIIPKPLIPLGDCTVIERIIAQFYKKGVRDFFATVNYKSEMIKFYFSELKVDYSIRFIKEEIPLGTGGSLSYLIDHIHSTFFVSNCDILVEEDMAKVLTYHRENRNDITIVASIYNHTIPYGTLVTSPGGILESMEEKPDIFYQVNTGIYILEPSVLKLIPKGISFHLTDLIMKVKNSGGKVGVYPVNAGSWMDIGQWRDYRRTAVRFGDSFE